jgi:prephenate dehydrogenase
MTTINTLAVIGVGLIGGSLSLALKQAGAVRHVVGVGRTQANLDEALRLGVIDAAAPLAQAAAQADYIFVATPVAQMPAVFAEIAAHARANVCITDGGSTKQDVLAAARARLGARFSRFVPAHPIAGTEKTGASAALNSLYRDRKVVITPTGAEDADALSAITQMWQTCGADVRHLSAEAHDDIFAAVSHLPHLLAFALVDELAQSSKAPDYFDYAASGFRDFTRIAAGSPEMWRDISMANRDALRAQLARYREKLDRYDTWLSTADAPALNASFARASEARRSWQAAIEKGESPRTLFTSE